MIVKLPTEHHLECLSLKGGCRGSSESTSNKMPHCWKSHALAHLCFTNLSLVRNKNLFLCETFDAVFKADQLSYFQLKTTFFESVLSFLTSV